MVSSPNRDDRQRRLYQVALEWGVSRPPPPPPLKHSLSSPASSNFRDPNDDYQAEELLKRQRLSASEGQQSQGGIKRAFTTNKRKGWEPKEIFDALDAHVKNVGSPGVAEALIAKLTTAGGDMNIANAKSKTNLLTRRKSMETFERSRILQKAIEHQQTDMVAVLVPHADPVTLDTSLPLAIRSGNLDVTALLMSHGANASQTRDGQDAFRQTCLIGGQEDMVALLLASDGRPNPGWVSTAMVDAAAKGCVETVLRLSHSTADGNYKNGAALKEAIAQSRVDVALAILIGTNPPMGACLNEAFYLVFTHPNIMPNEKMGFADILLCAGAEGDMVADALVNACQTGFFEMVNLLVSHGTSIEYQNATVLRNAIAQGKSSLVHLLLSERSRLSPIYASECVSCIPKKISNEDRNAFLTLLLRKGASGQPLSDCLIDATEDGDIESVKLLLTPLFPGGRLVERHDLRKGPRSMVFDRHATASVDYRGGMALQFAIMTTNVAMVQAILASSKPSLETMSGVFPYISNLSPIDRYQMAECLLATGLSGPCVHEALQLAIDEHPPRRDERLIALLLRHNADPTFNGGASVMSAVAHQDLPLLQTLLQSRPSPQAAAAAIPTAMALGDPKVRARTMFLLLTAGAGQEGKEVPAALVFVLQTRPTDMPLLDILLKQGAADVNFDGGKPVVLAAQNPDTNVLEILLSIGKATPETLSRGMEALADLPTTPAKAAKLESILRRSKQRDGLNRLLLAEVESVLKTHPQQRDLSVLNSLVSSGADVNALNAAALCHSIAAANSQITDMLFKTRPNPFSLAAALPHALSIQDPMDRLAFTKKLLQAGAPAAEANRALIHAINTFTGDLPLINSLVSAAETGDGEALSIAVKKGSADITEMILRKKCVVPVLNEALAGAMGSQDREKRKDLCSLLLKSGASGTPVSDALLVSASDGDLVLGTLLLQHGASVEHQDGQAIVAAARSGASDVLGMLLQTPTPIKDGTLARGFQAATEVGDLSKRAEVFHLLLRRGVKGDVVDEQLVSAARFGDDGLDLLKLLLEFGASTDFNGGEAIWTATRSASMASLQLLLGLAGLEGKQQRPSSSTLLRALKASKSLSSGSRYQAIEWLLKAGLPITDEVHLALIRAVKDEEPNLKLIRLLLENGASPLSNGCEALVDATQRLSTSILEVLLDGDIPASDLAWVFSQSFTLENIDTWLVEEGYQVAKLLMEKGANGDGPATVLVVAIDDCGTERDAIARKFVDLLIHHQVDTNFRRGLPLQAAARLGDLAIIKQVLGLKPNGESTSMAFPYIFDRELNEDQALEVIGVFGDYNNAGERLDVMFKHPFCEPVVYRALSQHPRSAKILQAIFDAGYYHDQMTMVRVMPEAEEDEEVTLLFWALLQPQKRVSSAVIEMLINKGAKVNFETHITKTTPLMLAIKSKRHDLVKSLILAGAEVDMTDVTGNTPLTMATRIGGDLGTMMMSNILAAEPSKNDGSLHNAARELNVQAMGVLVQYGHDPDFPSPIHGGRSALGEICLHASDSGELTAAKEKDMEKAMTYLIDQGTDLTLQSHGKSVLILALDAHDPLRTTRALLKVGYWKHIDHRSNNYTDATHTYSPTMYVQRVLSATSADDTTAALLTLLRANRAKDVFFANDGPQPQGATGLPDDLLRAERERKARADRLAADSEEHARTLARTREIAQIQNQIFTSRAEIEDARSKRAIDGEIGGMKAKAAVQEELFNEAVRRQRAERREALEHGQTMAEAELNKARLVAETEMEVEGRRQLQALEWDRARVENAKMMSAVKVREREDLERLEKESDVRFRGRVAEQRRLVDSQTVLATRLTSAGVNGRQIGYITGELPD